jgi:hypothetical protein
MPSKKLFKNKHLQKYCGVAYGFAASIILLQACVASAAETASTSSGQAYPARPIRVIVPLPPGTATDFIARTLSVPLGERQPSRRGRPDRQRSRSESDA